jgi:uracil-DNA glycosylase family 4
MSDGSKRRSKKPYEGLPILSGEGRVDQLGELYREWRTCTRCPLHALRAEHGHSEAHPIVFASGNPDARLMIVGGEPGMEEAEVGLPFVGDSGKILSQLLASVSADTGMRDLWRWFAGLKRPTEADMTHFYTLAQTWRETSFFLTNAVACRAAVKDDRIPNRPRYTGRDPTRDEWKACRPRLEQMIYTVDPVLILALGNGALSALVGKVCKVTAHRGRVFEINIRGRHSDVTYPVLPTFSPAYLLQCADWAKPDGNYAKTRKDLMTALQATEFLSLHHHGELPPLRGER